MQGKFIYQEVGGITANGERIVKPRFVGSRQISTYEFLQEVMRHISLTRGELLGALTAIGETLPYYLAQGNSVKLDGIGVFSPTLTMRNDVPIVETEEDGREVRHNARSVVFDTIRYTPDRDLLIVTANSCHPLHDRYQGDKKAMPTQYDEAERWQRLHAYLVEHATVTVSEYMSLTGMRRTKASMELRGWSQGEGRRLEPVGRVPHRYYILAGN
ncbi:MAG: hypothetical protein IJT48_04925 [Bacteroidaceae bacterium]|nr:hypothetical protein [Bacteroidaceae bacterium]